MWSRIMGLPRQLHLRQTQDFDRLRRSGKTYRHRLLLLNVLANDLTHNRYGVVTGKKLGGAVVRNRVRRLLRESLRGIHPRLQSGFDVVIVAHPAAVGQPLAEIQRTISMLMRQAGLLTETGEPTNPLHDA